MQVADGPTVRDDVAFEAPFVAQSVKEMPEDFGAAVNGEVLGCGNSFQIVRVVALQAGNECHADAAGKKWIFSVGFLAAPPARVTKDIDVGRPKGETEVAAHVSMLNGVIVFGARFRGDHIG